MQATSSSELRTYDLAFAVSHAITGDLASEDLSTARSEISRGCQAVMTALSDALLSKSPLLDIQSATDAIRLCASLLETLEVIHTATEIEEE
jgi:hypothetical protein